MKIILVNPPVSDVYADFTAVAPKLPPLGLCYLASVLIDAGHRVVIIDCPAEKLTLQMLVGRVLDFSPDVVGIAASTVSFNSARAAAEAIKSNGPKITTILGGVHISALPEESMLEAVHFDYGVYGEGEQTIVEVVNRLARGRGLDGVAGTIYRIGGEVIINPPRSPIMDLDSLPLPARHLLKSLRLYSPPITRIGKGRATSVISSRGCPFGCTFCDQAVFGRTWRAHNPTYVVAELTHLIEKYGVRFVTFEDDFFLMSRERISSICNLMADKSLKIGWGCSVRPGSVDEEILA